MLTFLLKGRRYVFRKNSAVVDHNCSKEPSLPAKRQYKSQKLYLKNTPTQVLLK